MAAEAAAATVTAAEVTAVEVAAAMKVASPTATPITARTEAVVAATKNRGEANKTAVLLEETHPAD